MTTPYTRDPTHLTDAFTALERDLLDPDGPRISTMRSSDKFAIVPYSPADEFALRNKVSMLTSRLSSAGWVVISISLQALLMKRLEALPADELEELTSIEAHWAKRGNLDRALTWLDARLEPLVEGRDGLAADVSARIGAEVARQPERASRMLALIGRAGAVWPFFHSSALLKHLAGRTHGVPVVLLYPGDRRGENGLSYMSLREPDRDYRPRIYP